MKPRLWMSDVLRHSRTGFTLVELLTVVAIVGVLGALVLATLAPMRANARKAKCVSNLRLVGVAFEQFAADFNGYYPAVTYNKGQTSGRVNPNKLNWWMELKPYLGNLDIKTIGGIDGNPFAICPDGLTGMNSKINYYYQTPRVTIGRPAKTILAGDSNSHALSLWSGATDTAEHACPGRHRGMANYLFVDGHVKTLALADANLLYSRDPYAP